MKINFLLSLFLFVFISLSESFAKPSHKGFISSINLGARYSSILQKRGVIFYGDYQIDPVLAVFLFDDQVEFLGDSINFHDDLIADRLRYRLQWVGVSDNPLFPNHDSVKSNYFDREDTSEVIIGLESFFDQYDKNYWAEVDFIYAKDVRAHSGNYLELQTKIKLHTFSLFNTRLEPHAVGRLGWGDARHNSYFYGPSAHSDAINNVAYGFWIEFPDEADRYFPILQLMRFETLGAKNRNAEYAQQHEQGLLFSFIATAGLLD